MSDPVREPVTRRRAVLLGGAVLIVVALVLALVLGMRSGDDDRPAAAAGSVPSSSTPAQTSTAAPSSTATAPPSEGALAAPTTDGVSADQLPDSLPTVPLDQSADVSGVAVALASIESIQGQAEGPGNVNGPALRVTVSLTNGAGTDLSLDGVSVNLAYGDDLTPASPLEDPSQDLFAGTAEPGSTARGVYVFSVPAGARDRVAISVGVQPGASYAVFSGPVS